MPTSHWIGSGFPPMPIGRRRTAGLLVALCLLHFCPGVAAGTDPAAPSGEDFISAHRGTFNGVEVAYTARFEDIVLENDAGGKTARIYATAYVRENVPDAAQRPVIFVWNGGPSAASQTLHMAGFGPRRLVIPADVTAPIAPPFETVHNEHTVLDAADLVFVDPVETGYSRILPAGDPATFYAVDGDAQSIAQFIQKWLHEKGRAHSPAFVMGTSYGSIRAALVAGILADSPTPLAGAFLLSQGVNLVETTQRANNLVGYASNLSQQAAIAWYHGRTALQDRPVEGVIDAAEAFAMGRYLVALARGRQLPGDEREAIAQRLEDFTGINRAWYLANGLRIKKAQFRAELLKDEGRVLGAIDARYTAPAGSEARPASPTQGVGDVHRSHLQAFLGVTADPDAYRGAAPISFGDWDWSGRSTLDGSKAPPGVKSHVFADFDYPAALTSAFAANPSFRILVATGIYDMLTTVGPARLLANDVSFPGDRVVLRDYAGGHAFYSNDAEFQRLADDVRRFVTAGSP